MSRHAILWLGTHKPHHLALAKRRLMVSRNTLALYKTLPQAEADWFLDSGGFTQLQTFGRWTISPAQYVGEVRRFASEIGRLKHVAPQDWMVEPFMLAKTGLDVIAHQVKTVTNYLELRAMAPEIPWVPVLQGWTEGEYHRCADLYEAEGVNLGRLPLVGLGSICRRQATARIEIIVRSLAERRLRLHGFGMKTLGLLRCADVLQSADSMAWSFDARRAAPLQGHTHSSCANCLEYMLGWGEDLEDRVKAGWQHGHQIPMLSEEQ